MINKVKTGLPGCYKLIPEVFQDKRGIFVKTFQSNNFLKLNLETDFREEYYSVSYKRVLRGLHFQMPPYDHVKVVYCVLGEVTDAVVDLRVGSPAYGKYHLFELNDKEPVFIYIPKGMAHGFYVTSETAIMMYKVSTVYSSEHDSGIRWNSLNIPWTDMNPVISSRDSAFISFKSLESPFHY